MLQCTAHYLSGPGFYQSILDQRACVSKHKDTYSDIYDGAIYKILATEGNVLHDQHNISVIFNTDGVEIFNSTKDTMWPVLLMINELPFTQRYAEITFNLGEHERAPL